MIRLFVNQFKSKDDYRNKEFEKCLEINSLNKDIDKIVLLKCDNRLTYDDFFQEINKSAKEEDISIIANLDIYLGNNFKRYLKGMERKVCYALSRWETNFGTSLFLRGEDSQDTWIFKGNIEGVYGYFNIGTLGCDNKLVYELRKAGYTVLNPSKTIKTFHIHSGQLPNNAHHDFSLRISPPYEFVTPEELKPFLSIVTRRHPNRSIMFKKNRASVLMQEDNDYEHVIIQDDVGVGSYEANRLFVQNKDKINGNYVFMLDDDDVLVGSKLITDLKEVVENHSPDLMFIKMLAGDQEIPSSEVWMKNELKPGHVGTSCVVVKNKLWKDTIDRFTAKQTGDFDFIKEVLSKAKKVVWVNKLYSKTMSVSWGKSEEELVAELVTGLVVTYNTKELVEKAINSVRRHHPNMRIVIIDGSDLVDPCYRYVERLADDKIRVFHTGYNIGHGRGLCEGIKYVDTPYVLIFDSDIEMVKSPLGGMLEMMEENTWGVGHIEKVDLGGHEYGLRKEEMSKGQMDYLHPYFCLIQMKEYKKYPSFIHHGAPAVNIMLYLHRMCLSGRVIKEFKGLGHTLNSGGTWVEKLNEWVIHRTRGTRDVRVKRRLTEIEGVWEKVVDPGVQNMNKEKVVCITCTGDRPLAFGLSQRWIENQTLIPDKWIVVDDGKVPIDSSKLPSFAMYVRRMPSGDCSMIQNLEEAFKYISEEKIVIWEDDEYYAPRYLEVMAKKLETYSLVGIGKSKYYHLFKRSYHHHANMGHASLAQTAFRKEFLPEVIGVLSGNAFLDIRIWSIVNSGFINLKETNLKERISKDGRALIFDEGNEYLYVGMKGMPGRVGIGSGHNGNRTVDTRGDKLKEWIPVGKDYNSYYEIMTHGREVVKMIIIPSVVKKKLTLALPVVKKELMLALLPVAKKENRRPKIQKFVRRSKILRRVSTISR